MAFDTKKYLEELAQEAGFDEEAKKAFLQVASNEKLSKRLSADVKRHDEFSRDMDALRKDKEGFDGEKKKWTDWYQGNVQAYDQMGKDRQALAVKAATYEQLYGSLDALNPQGAGTVPGSNAGAPSQDWVSKKDLDTQIQAAIREAVAQNAGLTAKAVPLALSHYKEFGEVLDFNVLVEEAKKVNAAQTSPLDIAYSHMVEARRTQATADAEKKRLDQARKDWEKDFVSKHNLPIDTRPREAAPFFNRPPEAQVPKSDDDRAALFTKIWEESTPQSQ